MTDARAGGLMGFDIAEDDFTDVFNFVPDVVPEEEKVDYVPKNSMADVLLAIEPPMFEDDIAKLTRLQGPHGPLFSNDNMEEQIKTLGIIAEFGTLYREAGTVRYGDGAAYLESQDPMLSRLLIQRDTALVYRYLHDLDGNLMSDANGLPIPVQFTLRDGRTVSQYISIETERSSEEYLFDVSKGFEQAFGELTDFLAELEANSEADFTWSSSALRDVKAQVDAINDAEVAVEASDEIGWCKNCQSKWLTHALIQTRSGDEALTNKYRCASCRVGKYYLHIYTREERDAYRARKKLEEEQAKAAELANGKVTM